MLEEQADTSSDDEWLPSRVYLIDRSPQLVAEWKQAFANFAEVSVLEGDYFQQPADAIVSPANSFGIMDGGLDLAIRDVLGYAVQGKVQRAIVERHHGELPIGSAEVVETGHEKWPYLIAAPTMRVPEPVAATLNAYVAFRAVLLSAVHFNRGERQKRIDSLVCSGLCTGVGRMSPSRCAAQMRLAYKAVLLPAAIGRPDSIHQFHRELHQA